MAQGKLIIGNIATHLATLVSKLQTRLTQVGDQTRRNTADIKTIFETAVRHDGPTINDLKISINDVKTENDAREGQQTLRDQNNVQSLVNLRDSTQKGFDQVRSDVENILKTLQRLNERVGQVESQNIALAKRADTPAWHHMVGLEARVTNIEHQNTSRDNSISLISNRTEDIKQKLNAPAPNSIPTDHVWVNKKLTGVYDSIEELEARVKAIDSLSGFDRLQTYELKELDDRVKKLESLITLYENLRKAQNDFAVANGKFLSGEPA